MPPALLLTAGLGTRLQPLTFVRAKAAVPIAGEPLVRRIIRWLASHRVDDLVLNLHHLPATITSVVGDGSDLGVRVRYSWEQPNVLGSAGGPRQALSLLGRDPFLLINGDTLTDLDVSALLAAHARSDALVTMALVPNDQPAKYGGVILDRAQRVTGFARRGPAADGSFHFVGVQVASGRAFSAVPTGQAANSVGGVYDDLMAREPGAIRGFVTRAAFLDVGTVRDYWDTVMTLGGQRSQYGTGARISPSARVERSILWDDVEVGADAQLADCIVTDGAVVPPGVSYRRAVIAGAGAALTLTPFD